MTWIEVKDGDPRVVGLYRRHYSCRKYNHGQAIDYVRTGITPPGETMILLSPDCSALFVWSLQRFRADGQKGVNCSVFRNESSVRASELIREACKLAWHRWPGERLFTFVDAREIRVIKRHGVPVPGWCFVRAGWTQCGESKKGLIILELLP